MFLSFFFKQSMSTKSQQVEEASLKAIEYLTVAISKSVQIEGTILSIDYFVEKCLQCCLIYLKDADLKLVWPSAKCLQSIASATETSYHLIIKILVKFLLDQYQQVNQLNQQKIYLDVLNKFLQIGLKYTNCSSYVIESLEQMLIIAFEIINQNHQSSAALFQHSLSFIETLLNYKLILTKHLSDANCELLVKQLWSYLLSNENTSHQVQIIRIILLIISQKASLFDYIFAYIEKASFNDLIMINIINHISKLNLNSRQINYKLEALINGYLRNYNDTNNNNNNHVFDSKLLTLFDIYRNLIEFNHLNNLNSELEQQHSFFKFLINDFKYLTMNENTDLVLKLSNLFQIYALKVESIDNYTFVFNLVSNKIEQLKSFEVS